MIPLPLYLAITQPNLLAGYNDFQLELARYLGSGSDPDLWTTSQISEMDKAIQEAYRYVLYPSRIPGGGLPHVWSFLRQTATLTTVAGGADVIVAGSFATATGWTQGTLWSIGSGVATGTAATGDLSQTTAPLTSGASYTVVFTLASVTAGSVRVVCGTSAGTTRSTNGTFTETIVANGAGFKIEVVSAFTGTVDNVSASRVGEEAYTLPADFGSIHNREITYSANAGFVTIEPTSLLDIRKRNQQSSQTGQPWLYATGWEAQTAGLNQRQKIVLYPTPDAAYVLTYEYAVLIGKLSVSNPYPLGGPRISQLMIEACKAVGMSKQDGGRSDIWSQFKETLGDAIALDGSTLTERSVGRMCDPDRRREDRFYSVRSTSGSTYAGIA